MLFAFVNLPFMMAVWPNPPFPGEGRVNFVASGFLLKNIRMNQSAMSDQKLMLVYWMEKVIRMLNPSA